MEEAGRMGVTPVSKPEAELGISHSLQLGLRTALQSRPPDRRGALRGLRPAGTSHFHDPADLERAAVKPGRIICAGQKQEAGNPVLWPAAFFPRS